MFIDWLKVHQDFDFELPLIGDEALHRVNAFSGEILKVHQPKHVEEGSYSSSINITISGNRITIDGNPSRMNRIDNLFGFTSLDDCMEVYNQILRRLGLPEFTKCTKTFLLTGEDGKKVTKASDGAIFTRIDATSNQMVGEGAVLSYIKAVSTQPYRHMKPHLYTNGRTTGWFKNADEQIASTLMYPCVYDKAYDLKTKQLKKVLRQYGENSQEHNYLNKIISYCDEFGVTRHEQKLRSKFLKREDLCFWGLADESKLQRIHDDFLKVDEKLQVTSMTLESIGERLLREGIVNNVKAANTTAMYAIEWSHGKTFDFSKSSVKTHRARLRKIGYDIALPCDLTRFSLVNVHKAKEIVVKPLEIPSWYQMPNTRHLRAVA